MNQEVPAIRIYSKIEEQRWQQKNFCVSVETIARLISLALTTFPHLLQQTSLSPGLPHSPHPSPTSMLNDFKKRKYPEDTPNAYQLGKADDFHH